MTLRRVIRPGGRLWVLVMCLGMLAIQVSWVLSIRPFAGIDEFSHFDRAAAVARGDWAPAPAAAAHGSGAWVRIPTELVRAAQPECSALRYTSPAECRGLAQRNGDTRVATSAGRYNPLFYALLGYPTLSLRGATTLLAMRTIGALACLTMFILAVLALRSWARGPWPAVSLVIACTPVAIYSSTVAAPNGLEIFSGITLWCAGLGFVTAKDPRPRLLTISTVVAGVVLVTLRPLGFVWCALILTTTVFAAAPRREHLRRLLRQPTTVLSCGVLAAAAVAGIGWTVAMKASQLSDQGIPPLPWGTRFRDTAIQVPLWLLQSIAAFPYRNEATSPVVYPAYLCLGIGLLIFTLRAGRVGRVRRALVAIVLISIGLPLIATLATFEKYGTSWQGRYALAFGAGFLLLCGWSIDRTGYPLRWPTAVPGAVLFVLAQSVSVVFTLQRQKATIPNGPVEWVMPSTLLITLLCSAGAILLYTGALRIVGDFQPRRSSPTPTSTRCSALPALGSST